jgi:uncharacterized protein YneF (UPF0154 family)
MKISEFKKLEESIQEQDFNRSFKNINKVMFFLSIFGHLASIFLAYFLISKILSGAITDNPILVGISSIILLGGLELLKREIFDKFSLQQIKYKSITNKDVLPLFLVSLVIVSISFYSSIKGAKEFSSKSKQIDTQIESNIKIYEDSIRNIYQVKVEDLNKEIANKRNKIEEKDKEQTTLESNEQMTRQQKSRVKDLKIEKGELKTDITSLETKIKESNQELDKVIQDYESKLQLEGKDKKEENKSNSFFFIVISTLIELMILAGVYFNEYYKWRSYDEFKKKIEKDPNFQKWYNYNSVLDVIFNEDTKTNDKLPSSKVIQDLCKVNGIILLNKDVIDLNKLFVSLGIIRTSGSSKYIAKSKETSQEILKKHFNIE